VADLAPGPEGEPLRGVEEVLGVVVGHPDGNEGMVPGAQHRFPVPPDLRREEPRRTAVGLQREGQDHQGQGVTRVP